MKNYRIVYYVVALFLSVWITLYSVNPENYWTNPVRPKGDNFSYAFRLKALSKKTAQATYLSFQTLSPLFFEVNDTLLFQINGSVFPSGIARYLALSKIFKAINSSEPKVVGVMGIRAEEHALLRLFNKTIVVTADIDPNILQPDQIWNAQYPDVNLEKTPPYFPWHNPYILERYYNNDTVMDYGVTIAFAFNGGTKNKIGKYYKHYNFIYGSNSIIKIRKHYYHESFSTGIEDQQETDTIINMNVMGNNKNLFSLSEVQSHYPEFSETILNSKYKDKIVILDLIDYNSSERVQYISDVVSNILGNESVKMPLILNGERPSLIYIVLLLCTFILIYNFKIIESVSISLSFIAIIASISLMLFFYANIFIDSVLFILPIVIVNCLLIPYEIISDRIQLLKQKDMLESELASARRIQIQLLPVENPKIPGFDIYGRTNPAYEVGGDFYDYLWLDNEKTKLGIAVADVSGKAMGAAMTAVMTSGMVYSETSKNTSPKEILGNINRPLYIKTEKNVFTALVFAVLDIRNISIRISNAGQVFPILVRKGSIKYLRIKGPRFPLGMMEYVKYEDEEISLQSQDVLLLYTDGISEAMNRKKELFGFERLENLLRNIPNNLSSEQISSLISKELQIFTDGALQHDDMTIVVVKVE